MPVKIPAQQGLEVRHFELFDRVFVLRDHLADLRQTHDRYENLVDRAFKVRREHRPRRSEDGAGALVDPVHGETRFEYRNRFDRIHGGKQDLSGSPGMVADNGCLSVNGTGIRNSVFRYQTRSRPTSDYSPDT